MGSLADLCASEVIAKKLDAAYEDGYNAGIKEFVEKLIERLQEEKQCATNDYNVQKVGGLRIAIENVKQLAAECEVKHIDDFEILQK